MTGIASRSQLRMSLLRHALVTVPLVLLLGTVSGRLAGAGADNIWFAALDKPVFMPSGWIFGAAWTILYILLGVALAMLLHARGARWRGAAIALFVPLLLATFAWPLAFFAFHQVGTAFLLLGAMIAMTLALVVLLWRIRRGAAVLMMVFLAWLGFAALLVSSIASLNPNAAEVAPEPASTDIVL
jgi:tryptophan-rich sensory protein